MNKHITPIKYSLSQKPGSLYRLNLENFSNSGNFGSIPRSAVVLHPALVEKIFSHCFSCSVRSLGKKQSGDLYHNLHLVKLNVEKNYPTNWKSP